MISSQSVSNAGEAVPNKMLNTTDLLCLGAYVVQKHTANKCDFKKKKPLMNGKDGLPNYLHLQTGMILTITLNMFLHVEKSPATQ